MDGIEQLRRQALLKRNAAKLLAKREYHAALLEIASLNRKLRIRRPGRPRKATDEHAGLKATTVAREVLLEGRPMTLVELTLEVQRRGCRSLDDPKVVAKAISSGLQYYRREFRMDEAGRWAIALPKVL